MSKEGLKRDGKTAQCHPEDEEEDGKPKATDTDDVSERRAKRFRTDGRATVEEQPTDVKWLADVKNKVIKCAQANHVTWNADHWTGDLEEVVLSLKGKCVLEDAADTLFGLIQYGVRDVEALKRIASTKNKFRDRLEAYKVTPVISNVLFETYVAPVIPQPQLAVSASQRHDRDASALARAEAFVTSIFGEYEKIPKSKGMSVLRRVVYLETGGVGDVVVRNITEPFWQSCIDEACTVNERTRVAVVGTPGIGKTASTAILIRMLLKSKRTVVYHIRTKTETGWFYEFSPPPNGIATNAENVTVKLYSESTKRRAIQSLTKTDTVYVVDPGRTQNDCVPEDTFQPKVIIVTSPDGCHWGGAGLLKQRDDIGGAFRYFPLWSLEELLSAAPVLFRRLDQSKLEDIVKDRYRHVGGVPRIVGSCVSGYNQALQTQNDAVNQLTKHEVKCLADGRMDGVGIFSSSLPKSAVVGFKTPDSAEEGHLFDKYQMTFISQGVADKFYTRHMKSP